MTDEHEHHEHHHAHEDTSGDPGVAFTFDGSNFTVSLAAAENAGLVGNSDRIQLPSGQLILLHPHAHEDNANDAESIAEKGGKVWPVE